MMKALVKIKAPCLVKKGNFSSVQLSFSIPHVSRNTIRSLLCTVMLSTSPAHRLSSNSVMSSGTSFTLAPAAVADFPDNKPECLAIKVAYLPFFVIVLFESAESRYPDVNKETGFLRSLDSIQLAGLEMIDLLQVAVNNS